MTIGTGSLIHYIFLIIAIYLSFKRNNGFSLWSFLVAIVMPEIYVVYVLATTDNLDSLRPGYDDRREIRYGRAY